MAIAASRRLLLLTIEYNMNIYNRSFVNIIHYFLDNICPPFLRDSKYFMYTFMRLAYGRETALLLDFKDKFPFMEDSELNEYYRRIIDVPICQKRKTHLNQTCLDYILKSVSGITGTVLDVGCNKGYLLGEIAALNPNVQCSGVDFAPPENTLKENTPFKIYEADISRELPFPDRSFDMVFCTHTLEHLRNPQKALSELIRVTKKRLIIVVPCQREYRYTTDFHVNFFPYMFTFKRFIGIKNAVYLKLDRDFLCSINID